MKWRQAALYAVISVGVVLTARLEVVSPAEQKPETTEQKLKVTAQELEATKQKLKVVERKLEETEQKLAATEQELARAKQRRAQKKQRAEKKPMDPRLAELMQMAQAVEAEALLAVTLGDVKQLQTKVKRLTVKHLAVLLDPDLLAKDTDALNQINVVLERVTRAVEAATARLKEARKALRR